MERHDNDWFQVNGKQKIKMAKKYGFVKFQNWTRKIKSQFMIYANFERILLPKNNEKKNPNKSYSNKNKNHVECSFVYKLLC